MIALSLASVNRKSSAPAKNMVFSKNEAGNLCKVSKKGAFGPDEASAEMRR